MNDNDRQIKTWDQRLRDQRCRGWDNYVKRRLLLDNARDRERWHIAGEFIYVEKASSASAYAEIRLTKNNNDPLDLEEGVWIKTVFQEAYISNAAQAGEWMDVIIGINFEYQKKKQSNIPVLNALYVSPDYDLQESYDWLKSSDRDSRMGALSAGNRRALILTPGVYNLTSQLVLDTDYVDLIAAAPAMGGDRLPTDHEWDGAVNSATPASLANAGYRPPPTIIASNLVSTSLATTGTVKQSADDIRMFGFAIVNLHNPGTIDIDSYGSGDIYASALCITASDNTPSSYSMMYFFQYGAGVWRLATTEWMRVSVYCTNHLAGFWDLCISNGFGFRVADNKYLAATMQDCIAGGFSYAGDRTGVQITGKFFRCRGIGYFNNAYQGNSNSGYGCFGGCRMYGCTIASSAEFYDCIAGNRSYGLGKYVYGNLYRCIGDEDCFAGYAGSGTNYGHFAGYAEDCFALGHSFGGGTGSSECSGELKRCILRDMPYSMVISNTTILRDTYIKCTSGSASTLRIINSTPSVLSCTIIAAAAESIWAAAPVNINLADCLLNKPINANVTNAIATPYNVIDTAIE